MSTVLSKPTYMPKCCCCGRSLQWILCTINCNNPPNHLGTEKCNHFSWGSPKSSPNTSPDLSSQAMLPAPSSAALVKAMSHHICGKRECKHIHIHQRCVHHHCHEYCIEEGGCSVQGHAALSVGQSMPNPQQSTSHTSGMGDTEYIDIDVEDVDEPFFNSLSESQPQRAEDFEPLLVDVRFLEKGKQRMKPPPDSVPHARYTFQIEPIFTKLHAKEQAQQQQQQQVDAMQREAIWIIQSQPHDHAVTNCTRFDELCIVTKPANLFSNLPGKRVTVRTAAQKSTRVSTTATSESTCHVLMSSELGIIQAKSLVDTSILMLTKNSSPLCYSSPQTHNSSASSSASPHSPPFQAHTISLAASPLLSSLSKAHGTTSPSSSIGSFTFDDSCDQSGKDDVLPRQWPGDYYTMEIRAGFAEIDQRKKQRPRKTVDHIFIDVFSMEFVAGTYYDHHARWSNASQSTRDIACDAGCTNEGLYSEFMRHNPTKHAEQKAARKRHVRA
ncbi:hypothetical protein HD554DRAFT_2044129 [Boletus coccyginus]|nr:hypothetical protein HD554DRAFT_2044129 [Boletus coccyginus]